MLEGIGVSINVFLAVLALWGTYLGLRRQLPAPRTVGMWLLFSTLLIISSAVLKWYVVKQKDKDILLAGLPEPLMLERLLQWEREEQQKNFEDKANEIIGEIKTTCLGLDTKEIHKQIVSIILSRMRSFEESSKAFKILELFPDPKGRDSLAQWVENIEKKSANDVLLNKVEQECKKHRKLIKALSTRDGLSLMFSSFGLKPKDFFKTIITGASEVDDETVRLYKQTRASLSKSKI